MFDTHPSASPFDLNEWPSEDDGHPTELGPYEEPVEAFVTADSIPRIDIRHEVERNQVDESDESADLILDHLSKNVVKPTAGMVFDRLQDVLDCYYWYARSRGFQASIKGIEYDPKAPRTEGGIWDAHAIRGRLQCSKAGKFKSKKKDPNRASRSAKTDCHAKLNSWRTEDGKWKVAKLEDDHNHELFPENVSFMKQFRNISLRNKGRLMTNKSAGISAEKNYQSMVLEYNGYPNVPFSDKDCRNMFDKERRLCLGGGDFATMQKYFESMASLCPDFMYLYDTDEQGRLRNVFWADGRSRSCFKDFRDVVSFYATYLKNRYRMPFCPFIGINHHGQSILLGCALLSSEDTENYIWLFEKWKACMGGVSLKGIITDRCQAIGMTLATVFSDTRQRWCLWHVMCNAKTHLQCHAQWEAIKLRLKCVIHNSLTVADFDHAWTSLLVDFNLVSNQWLKSMYMAREMWVPVFFRDQFWAGMSTTQRSEGMNNFFKSFVNLNLTLLEFANQFSLALAKRANDEVRETFESTNSPVQLCSDFMFEPIFQNKYTNKKFIEVQEQIKTVQYQVATKLGEQDDISVYKVVDKSRRCLWIRSEGVVVKVVMQRSPCEISCECMNYEFRGILCGHIFRIFHEEGIEYVPQRYVIDRWRKDIPRYYLRFPVPHYKQSTLSLEPTLFRRLQDKFDEVAYQLLGKEALAAEFMTAMHEFKMKALSVVNENPNVRKANINGVGWVYCGRRRQKDEALIEDNVEVVTVEQEPAQEQPVLDPKDKRKRGRAPNHRAGYQVEKNRHQNGKTKRVRKQKATVNEAEVMIFL